MKKLQLIAFTLLGLGSLAQAQLKEGAASVDKLCGCFDIEFKYAETFSPDKNYKFHDREVLGAKELALAVERTDKKIVIQHLLVIDDSTIVKHWREDWVYEQPYIWKYQPDKKWLKTVLRPEQYKGKWTQTVWEVDDAPRYQGISDWVTTDNKTFWLNTTDAPLPRREYTTRDDYNVLRRGNRLVLSGTGYTHEQDNDKIRKDAVGEKLIAQEKGYNIYRKAADKDCASAAAWWKEKGVFWTTVRTEWDKVFINQNSVQLQAKVDNKRLSNLLDDLCEKWEKKQVSGAEVSVKAREILQKFAPPVSANSMAGK